MSKPDKTDAYINLTQNGRLMPSWVSYNFKKYKLDDMLKRSGEDPCGPTDKDHTKELKQDLRKYQLFVSQFLDYRSTYKGILLYHGLGSQKNSKHVILPLPKDD